MVKWSVVVRWALAGFFYVQGVALAFRAVLIDRIVGWKTSDSFITEWLNRSVSNFAEGLFSSATRNEGYEIAKASSELLIPISIIFGIVFLLLAYKLTPKQQS